MTLEYHSENNNEQADQEHKDGNAVEAVHIADPTACRFIGISFPDIKIFGQFA